MSSASSAVRSSPLPSQERPAPAGGTLIAAGNAPGGDGLPASQVVSSRLEFESLPPDQNPPEIGGFQPQTTPQTTAQGGEDEATPMSVEATVGLSLIGNDRARRNVGGRPRILDEIVKGQVVALLATGLSLRHAAAVLRLSHSTICETSAADPQFREEITQARLRAELLPLQTIVRESRRSWRAATWLMNHLKMQRWNDRTPAEKAEDERESKARSLGAQPGREPVSVTSREHHDGTVTTVMRMPPPPRPPRR